MDITNGIHIVFDGGSKSNGSANKGYGSFITFSNGKKVKMSIMGNVVEQAHWDFPDSTSNEAEWKTCIMALSYAYELILKNNKFLDITLHGDSANVIQGLSGGWKTKAENLMGLRERAERYAEITMAKFQQEPRELIVKILGH